MELKKLQKNTINMRNKLVSIILPVYNGEKYLKSSIESCLNQSYKNIELIIINDTSSDSSGEIAEEYAKKLHNVQVIHNTTNLKLPASLNIGLSKAKGEYLTWTSHDNLYDKTAIEELISNINGNDIVYSNYRRIDEDGNIISEINLPDINYLFIGNCIGASFLFTKSIYKKVGGYNKDLFLIEDYDFWVKAKLKGANFFHLTKSLYSYRIHQSSLTNSRKNDILNAEIKYLKQLLNIQSDALYFHFKRNILINDFTINELIDLSMGWHKLILKLINDLQVSIDFISKFLKAKVKNHLILIYIANIVFKNIKIEANYEFINYYKKFLSNIPCVQVDSHKEIYIYFNYLRMNIANENGISMLLEMIVKEKK